MNRRDFIRGGMAVAAVCCVTGGMALPPAVSPPRRKKNRIGIQLYSIREDLPKDISGCLKKLSDTGYSAVEAYGFDGRSFIGKPLKEWSLMLKEFGMTLSGAHCGTGLLPDDMSDGKWDYWRSSIAEMKEADGKRLIQAWLPTGKSVDELKKVAEQFNRVGELCKAGGVKFGYHNHHSEFKAVEGEIILDVLLKNTDPELVFFQMDLGHAVNGGGNIGDYFRKYPKRFPVWHASDFKKGAGYTEVGQGDVPYSELFKDADLCGLEELTVEQETEGDIFASCKRDFDFLRKFKWTKI